MININPTNPTMVIFQDANIKIDGEYSPSFNCFNLSDMVLEIKGTDTCDIVVEGAVRIDDNESYTPLALINASDYSVVDKAESKGLYYFSLIGCQKVRLKVSNLSTDTIITMMEAY